MTEISKLVNNPPYRHRAPTANQSGDVLNMQHTKTFVYEKTLLQNIVTSGRIDCATRSLYES